MELPVIAPAPANRKPEPLPILRRIIGFSCQACARRKVKCDKVAPACAACRKSGIDCVYEAPPPRSGKRLVKRHVLDRLAQYERVLRRHGLLEMADADADVGLDAAPGTSAEIMSGLTPESTAKEPFTGT